MRFGRLLLSIGLVGLATALGGVSLAQPAPAPGKPGDAGKPGKPGKPDVPGARPPMPEYRPGMPHDPHGMPGHGPGQPGREGWKDQGMPGRPGMGPMGMPGHRFTELVEKEKAGTLTEQERAQLEQLRQVHSKFRAFRELRLARFQELEGKQKAGTLTDEEKGELAKIQAIQQRFEALKQKHIERAKDRAKRRHLAKKKALETFPGADKNSVAHAEFAKHGKRTAMLDRAREVAEAGGRDELVARIDKLLEKEQARHAAWVERHKLAKAEKGATP